MRTTFSLKVSPPALRRQASQLVKEVEHDDDVIEGHLAPVRNESHREPLAGGVNVVLSASAAATLLTGLADWPK